MKYLKTFEESNNKKRYKKYIIYKASDDIYFLLEPTYYLPEYIRTDKLYTYNKRKNNLKKNRNQFYNFNYERYKNVIFESDDLKNLKDTLLTLHESDKYNL